MKTKSNIEVPKGTTHVCVTDSKGRTGQLDVGTFTGLTLTEVQDMAQTVEFVKISGKGKYAKRVSLGAMVPLVITGQVEATSQAIQTDASRADAIANGTQSPDAFVTDGDIPDELSAVEGAPIWNLGMAKQFPEIKLREESNMLARFEYVPTQLALPGVKSRMSRYSILTCSDNGYQVGKPFAGDYRNAKGQLVRGSYSLLNNSDFIGIVETICKALDGMGLKWRVTTTGTLQERERSFITIQILEPDKTTLKIGNREFQAFLNCLNSIPSNSGCTVTFANNSFCVCCRNTFAHCLQDKGGAKLHVAIKHTKGMKIALADVPVIVNAYFDNNAKLFANLKAFQAFPVSLEQAEQYFAAYIGNDGTKLGKGELPESLTDKTDLSTRAFNMVARLKELFVTGKGNGDNNMLALFSAVTDYYTHESAGETEDTTKQFESSEHGSGATNKALFYAWLVRTLNGAAKAKFNAIAKVGETLLVQYAKKA